MTAAVAELLASHGAGFDILRILLAPALNEAGGDFSKLALVHKGVLFSGGSRSRRVGREGELGVKVRWPKRQRQRGMPPFSANRTQMISGSG